MSDIVPALNEEITRKFNNNMMRDRRAARITKRIQDGTADLLDGHEYAQALGESLSNALRTTLTEENLPDGTMFFNIADRTVKPALRVNYELVNDNAAEIQKIVDNGIGLNAVRADFPEGRINGLIDKIVDNGLMWLTEPIINNTEAFFDDYIKANAEARSEAGLDVKIIRTAAFNCCKWCAGKEGTFSYNRAELDAQDIFARHEFCRCSVIYSNGKTRQNIWSKKTWEATPEELERRKDIRGRPVLSERERMEALRASNKDRYIGILRAAGYDNDRAQTIYARALAKTKDDAELLAYIENAAKVKRR